MTSHFSSLLTLVSLDYSGTSITFAKTRFGYIEVLFHTLYCNWGRKYRSLYQGLRYIEVPLYEREREIGLTPLPRFWLLSQFAHSHPFESGVIPTPLPRQFSLEEVLDCSTWTWQFNSYSTIISGDRTKWLSINSLLFWKIGRGIVQGGGGGGGGGFAVSFFMILSKIVSPWGLPITWWSFGLK